MLLCEMAWVRPSHLRRLQASAPSALSVSSPFMVSNRWAVRCELSWVPSLTARASGARAIQAMPISSGMATSGTRASQLPTNTITARYSSTNGRSPNTVSELDAKNSRTDSKSRTVLASTPPDAGRLLARMRRHCAKTRADSATSMRRAADSSRLLRSRRITNSNANTRPAADVSTPRLPRAPLGTTLSYTAIE